MLSLPPALRPGRAPRPETDTASRSTPRKARSISKQAVHAITPVEFVKAFAWQCFGMKS